MLSEHESPPAMADSVSFLTGPCGQPSLLRLHLGCTKLPACWASDWHTLKGHLSTLLCTQSDQGPSRRDELCPAAPGRTGCRMRAGECLGTPGPHSQDGLYGVSSESACRQVCPSPSFLGQGQLHLLSPSSLSSSDLG